MLGCSPQPRANREGVSLELKNGSSTTIVGVLPAGTIRATILEDSGARISFAATTGVFVKTVPASAKLLVVVAHKRAEEVPLA